MICSGNVNKADVDKAYGIGKVLLTMDIDRLRRQYNSGGMPMPMTKDGYWDLETSRKIAERVCRGY